MKTLLVLATILSAFQLMAQPLSIITPRGNPVVPVDSVINIQWNHDSRAVQYEVKVRIDSSGVDVLHQIIPTSNTQISFAPHAPFPHKVSIIAIDNQGAYDSSTCRFQAFDPLADNRLFVWLDPQKGISKDASNRVNAWQNIISGNYSAVQGNNARKPILQNNVLNGLPLLSFDGSDGLTIASLPMGEFTFIQFWRNNGGNAVIYEHSPNTNQNGGGYLFTSNLCSFGSKRGTVFSTKDLAPGWGEKNEYIVSSHRFGGSHQSNELFLNSVLQSAPTCVFAGNPGSSIEVQNLYIGSRNNSSLFMRGVLGDQLMFNDNIEDSLRLLYEQFLMDKYATAVSLGKDTLIEYGICGIQLSPISSFKTYKWNTGESTSSITAQKPGIYWLEGTDVFGRISRDTIVVNHPLHDLNDTSFCAGTTLSWDLNLSSSTYTFQWNTGNNSGTQIISSSNIYQVTITDSFGCNLSLGAAVTVDSFSAKSTLGPDTSTCAGESLSLLNIGSSIVQSYQWSTGDTTPSIIVTQSGDYSVTATNANGCELRDTVNISILSGGLPEPDFATSSLCASDSISFTDLSTPPSGAAITSWFWDFGDNTTTTVPEPTHQFPDSGFYNVTLNVATSDGCSKSLTRQLFVQPDPLVNFSVFSGGCHATPTQFRDQSQVFAGNMKEWTWDFGNGQTSTDQNPSIVYDQPGVYDIQLIGTSIFGCTDSITKQELILGSPLANFTFDPACSGSLTQFYDESNTDLSSPVNQWSWDFDDNTSSNVQDPAHLYLNPGVYDVSLQVTATNGCSTDTIISVAVYQTPEADFAPDSVCQGVPFSFQDLSDAFGQQIVDWQWAFGDGNTDTVANPDYVYSDLGVYNVKLRVENGVQCADSITHPVEVFPLPVADFQAQPNFGAAPIDIRFANRSQGDANSEWLITDTAGNVLSNSNDDSPTYTFERNGQFKVQLVSTNVFGCTDTVVKDVFVAVPILDLLLENIFIDQILQPDGSYKVTMAARVRNIGTRVVTNFDIEASLGNGTIIAETWEGTLNPGQSVFIDLKGEFVVRDISQQSFVCLEATNINNAEPDDRPNDNERCEALEEFIQVSDPYPNPAQNNLTFDVILPDEADLTVEVFNEAGQRVYTLFDGEGQQGLNRFQEDISALAQGTYVLRLRYKEDRYSRKFVVQR